uniref:Uncharacterized protein n=1 Tax=Oryza punctata TaxID=4537 RepID=A0A0E0KXB6_ORYPU
MWEQEAAPLRRKEKRKTRRRGAHARWEKKRNEPVTWIRIIRKRKGQVIQLQKYNWLGKQREKSEMGSNMVKSNFGILLSIHSKENRDNPS